MNNTALRPAIAMVELIFALVIIGIVLMSAPMLISQATKSGFVAIQQEGINEASTKVNMIMGYQWDENNTDESFPATILHVTSGDGTLNENNVTTRRLGTPLTSERTFSRSDGQEFFATPGLGFDASDSGIEDDMDDFTGSHTLIEIDTAKYNYVETTTIQIATTVSYIADTPGGGTYYDPGADGKLTFSPNFSSSLTTPNTTNIKKIVVTLTSTSGEEELNKTIILNAFSCNIGSYNLASRTF